MLFSVQAFDEQTRSLLTRALEDAWREVRAALRAEPLDATAMRETLVRRITAAARDGERDPSRLKLAALGAV